MDESITFAHAAWTQTEHGAALHETTAMNVLVKKKYHETSDIFSSELVDAEGGVLDGIPDHSDTYRMPEERASNDQFLPCGSRARSSRLVLISEECMQ